MVASTPRHWMIVRKRESILANGGTRGYMMVISKPNLPNVQRLVEGDILCLEPADYVPIVESWGYCLHGFMAGKFTGRDAIERLILTWAWPARVAFHPNGWMVFRFETAEDMDAARLEGNFSVFGTPLMICTMPEDFNFEEAPEFKFKVWASLPGLQLEL